MKTMLVTGGAQGIGLAMTERFLKDGWAVTALDIDPEAGDEILARLGMYPHLRFIQTDAAQEEQVEKAVTQALQLTGTIDCIINNAAVLNNKPIEQLTLPEWNRVLSVNLTSVYLTARFAAPALRQSHGSIINIASTRALQSEPDTEAYSASKGGVLSLTHALAVSLAPLVRVNAILPGWIEVGDWKKKSGRAEVRHSEADNLQHPAGRVGRPEDIAALAAFLASPEAGFITGAQYTCDGGMTRKMIYV